MARSSQPPTQTSNENSKEQHTTRAVAAAAATAIVASEPSPVATRSAAAAAAKQKAEEPAKKKAEEPREFILPLPPKPASRRFGCWAGKEIKATSMPELETIVKRDHPTPHPALIPYWGDVDDDDYVYLFDVPTANYVPIMLPGDVTFTDTQIVSSYLINYMPSFIK